MTNFIARFPGWCSNECGVRIEPGDMARYSEDGELMHEVCASRAEREARPICKECFMEIALNGTCTC